MWYAVVVPVDIPDPIAQQLKSASGSAFKNSAFEEAAEKAGFVVGQTRTGAENKRYVADEKKRWSSLIKAQNISLDTP